MHDVGEHIIRCRALFAPWLSSPDWTVAANAMLILCGRIDRMITRQLECQLEDFSAKGGFTENLTQSRLNAILEDAVKTQKPLCPLCGKPMMRRLVRKGAKQGKEFWGCTAYPDCRGTRKI